MMSSVGLFMLAIAYFSDATLSNIKSYISTDEEMFSGLFVNAAGGVSQDAEADPDKTCDNGYAVGKSCKYNYPQGYVELNKGERICNSWVMFIPGSYMMNT
jgi:hypothetical protein